VTWGLVFFSVDAVGLGGFLCPVVHISWTYRISSQAGSCVQGGRNRSAGTKESRHETLESFWHFKVFPSTPTPRQKEDFFQKEQPGMWGKGPVSAWAGLRAKNTVAKPLDIFFC
jgi:hypothetical protein